MGRRKKKEANKKIKTAIVARTRKKVPYQHTSTAQEKTIEKPCQ